MASNARPRVCLAGAAFFLALLVPLGARSADVPRRATLELVESVPVETTLDHPELRDAHDVWLEMIEGAERSLDFAQFYATSAPGSRLEPIIDAIGAAAARGVRVRFLVDELFYAKESDTADRIGALRGVELRRFDARAHMGGVHHAKFFVVDDESCFLGSQNFDWRSLTHILELGVRTDAPGVVAVLRDIFAEDWALAAGKGRPPAAERPASYGSQEWAYYRGAATGVTPVVSPHGFLPDDALWDLPRLVELIDGAKKRVRVQLMSYGTVDREGRYFDVLEAALRRAAARGVSVRLLVADWCKREKTIEGLQSLQALRGITVKLVTIPRWSGGFIPYARVIHAKFLVVDGEVAWIGTSNWKRDYFHSSRNVGLIVRGKTISAALEGFFGQVWGSGYAAIVDPGALYEPPPIGREK